MTTETNEKIITIDGVEYPASTLPLSLRNIIVARAEIVQNRVRHEIEIEKIDVLTDYYNKKIKKELENINGSDSKSKD
jgi:hypothetical protein